MKFTRELPTAIAVRSVSAEAIAIGDRHYDRTIAITTGQVLDDWVDAAVEDLTIDDFSDLLATDPEIVVLGTGSANIFAPRELVFAFARRSIGLEVMDTRAAARTFNVLAGEGRQVAAVLYLQAGSSAPAG